VLSVTATALCWKLQARVLEYQQQRIACYGQLFLCWNVRKYALALTVSARVSVRATVPWNFDSGCTWEISATFTRTLFIVTKTLKATHYFPPEEGSNLLSKDSVLFWIFLWRSGLVNATDISSDCPLLLTLSVRVFVTTKALCYVQYLVAYSWKQWRATSCGSLSYVRARGHTIKKSM